MILSKTNKTIKLVWNHKGDYPKFLQAALLDAYLNESALPEDISDIFTYSVYEAENSTNLIIDFV